MVIYDTNCTLRLYYIEPNFPFPCGYKWGITFKLGKNHGSGNEHRCSWASSPSQVSSMKQLLLAESPAS